MALVTVNCPLCGSGSFTQVYPGTLASSEDAPASYFSSSRTNAGHLPVVRCQQCGLVMSNPRDDEQTLQSVYALLQDQVYDEEETNRRRTANDHLRVVARYARPGRLLDAGCATGFFLAEAQRQGWEATGLEPSRWAVERARQRAPAATVVQGSIEQADFPAGYFDAITLWDVLEHVNDPAKTIGRLHTWLAPGGFLFLNVPNSDSLMARLSGRRWVLLLREHLWYFSPGAIGRLMQKCGLQLLDTRPNYVWFSLENILTRLAQYPGPLRRVFASLSRWSWLKAISFKFSMGEMNVIARKQK